MPSKEVAVINKSATTREDSFHGIQYRFKPNEKVILPLEAAVHLFGFGLSKDSPRMTEVLRRSGFTGDRKVGLSFLENFEMKSIDYVPAEDAEELSELKIILEEKNARIKELEAENEKNENEIKNLSKQVELLKEEMGGGSDKRKKG